MSTAEPFMPAHEPPELPDPRDKDVNFDVDFLGKAPVSDADADAAAARQTTRVRDNPFRTPTSGSRLSREALEKELDES